MSHLNLIKYLIMIKILHQQLIINNLQLRIKPLRSLNYL